MARTSSHTLRRVPARSVPPWVVVVSTAALILLAAAGPTSGCQLDFVVNPQLSTLAFGGSVVKPLAQLLVPSNPNAAVGLQGAVLALTASDSGCGSDSAGLLLQLAGAVLQTTPELGPVELYPESIQANAGSLATLELFDVAVNLTTDPLAAAAGAAASASAAASTAGSATSYTSVISAAISRGYAVVAAPLLTPEPITVQLEGLQASNSTQVYASAPGAQLVRLDLSSLYLTFPYTLQLSSGSTGSTIQVELEVVLQGSLVLEAGVGCPADCGPHGKCWPGAVGNSSAAEEAAAGAPVCVCECGWAGAACDVPSGFCPRYLGETTAVCPAPTPSPPPTTNTTTPAECPTCTCTTAEDCNSHQQYNSAGSSCECLPGWVGPECQVCQTDTACNLAYGVQGATCGTSYRYTTQSQYKVYSCELQALTDLLRKSFTVSCNTSAPQEGDEASGRYCQLDMEVLEGGGAMTCRMSRCSFRANSTRIDCATTHCACASACPTFQPLIDMAEGQPVVFDCNPVTGICTTDIKDFVVVVPAACTAAECLVEGYSIEEGTYTVPGEHPYNAIIAAVPLVVVVLVAALLCFLLFSHRSYWRAIGKPHTESPMTTASVGGGLAAPGLVRVETDEPVQELRFEQLSCAVPLPRGGLFFSALSPGGTGRRRCAAVGHVEAAAAGSPKAAEESDPAGMGASPFGRTMSSSSSGSVGAVPPKSTTTAAGGSGSSGGTSGCEMKLILRGVSGVARRGELVGVLGPSGCGKSTLLSLITGAAEHISAGARLEGRVLLDGVAMGAEGRRKVAFVPEDDTLLSTLTVAECLTCMAMLRLPSSLSSEQIQAQVWRVISELDLEQVACSRVGGQGARAGGISGGERRRVTIGQELVAHPAVLVLDEPTSRLDSHTALHLMRTLKRLACAGRIVLLSFHQPSPAMFGMIDRAYLLAGGQCMFEGPPCAVEGHFAAHGLPCPVGAAPAEHMLEVVSDPVQLEQLMHSMQATQALVTAVQTEQRCGEADMIPPQPGTPTGSEGEAAELGAAGCNATSKPAAVESTAKQVHVHARRARLSREVAVVFWRTLLDIARNPSLLLLHWVLAVAMGLLMGCIFFDVPLDMSGIQNRGGGIYFSLAFFAFTSLTTTDLLMAERRLVVREVRGGDYSPATYLLCKAVVDGLLLRVIPALLYSAPFYPMMGLQSGSTHVALYLMTVCTYSLAVAALSQAVAVGCTTAGRASLLLTFIFLVSLLVGGFLVNVESIPGWIGWLHYLSLFYYGYVILTTNEAAALTLSVEVKGYTAIDNVRGLAVLDTFGIDADKLTTWIIVLDCLYVACLLLALGLLYWRLPRSQTLQAPAVERSAVNGTCMAKQGMPLPKAASKGSEAPV